MSDYRVLVNNIHKCTICSEHLPLEPKPIFQFNPQARILIAGQAPGRKTHVIGRPFDDASGERLRDWMGINKRAFYNDNNIALLPMGFCFPGTGKSGDLPPRPECATQWRVALMAHLKNVELTLIIGKFALDWHGIEKKEGGAKKVSVTEHIAHWRDTQPQVFPLPHPSPRNNLWLKRNPWFEAELLPQLRERVGQILR